MAAKEGLDGARSKTDKMLRMMHIWPGVEPDGHMFKSRYLFKAVLDRHRTVVKVSGQGTACVLLQNVIKQCNQINSHGEISQSQLTCFTNNCRIMHVIKQHGSLICSS